jgi:uncharacterized membrane protein YeiH
MDKKAADLTMPAIAIVAAYAGSLIYHGATVKEFFTFTNKSDYVFLATMAVHMLKCCNDANVRGASKSVYWPVGLVFCGAAAMGGGFLAPLMVGRSPVVFLEETLFWMLVAAWYVTYHMPVVSDKWANLAQSKPMSMLLLFVFGVFRTHQQVACIEIGAQAAALEDVGPKPRFFSEPYAALLVCGFLGGCGGMFIPFSKGLDPISKGKNFPVTMAFYGTIFYVVATRVLAWDKLNAKMALAVVRVIGELLPAQRDTALAVVRPVYKVLRLPEATPLPQ